MSSNSSSTSLRPAKKRKSPPTEEVPSDDDESSSSTSEADEDEPDDDAHVLSHAERRRQKKRELKAAKAVEVAAPKKRKLDDSSAIKATKAAPSSESKPKRENSVWVGNLSYKTTRDALEHFFDGIGEITRIHMPKRPVTGENLGFAYVDFATSDAKITAITLSEGRLDGRNLLIKDGSDFTGRPAKNSEGSGNEAHGSTKSAQTGHSKTAQKILHMQKQPPAPTLFLGNLGFEVTEDTIRELFESHQNFGHVNPKEKVEDEDANGAECEGNETGIRKIRMGTFEDSGKCKGFAFVDFTSIERATNALINPRNHRLKGRDLVVEYASPDAVRRGGGGPRIAKPEQQGKKDKNHSKDEQKTENSPTKRHKRPVKPEHRDDTTASTAEDKTELATISHEARKRGSEDRAHKRRAKPGAALAQAPRQSAAIVPSQGQKIVF